MAQGTKEVLVISNYWHNPGIKVSIVHNADAPKGGITLETPLEDYLKALALEMAHPLKIWTRDSLTQALTSASNITLEKIKEASSYAVASGG